MSKKKQKIKEESEDDEDEDIDYANVFGVSSNNVDVITREDDLVPVSLATDIDCNLTRADYDNSQVINAYKQICTILALDLFVEHGEPLRKNEFYFGQEREEEQKNVPVFHL